MLLTMHLLRCHAALSLLLPLLLASVVVVLVEASTAAFLSRNLRSSLTEASKRQVRDADTILLKRSFSLSFGLLVRGGHADNDKSTQMESVAETKVDNEPTAEDYNNEEIASCSERHQSAWEEEIKRTQSFYLAESENRSKSSQDKVNIEDVRAYGSSQTITPTSTGGDNELGSADMREEIVEAFDTETCDEDIGSTEVDAQVGSEQQSTEAKPVANVVEEEILDKEVVDEEQSTIVEEETSADNEESASSSNFLVREIEEEIEVVVNDVADRTGEETFAEISNTDILEEENEEKVDTEKEYTVASADEDAGASVDVKDNGFDKIDENILSEEEVVDDNGESRASDFAEYTTEIATDVNEDNTPLLQKVNDLLQVLLLRGRSIHRKVSKVVTIVSQNKPQIAAVAFAALVSVVLAIQVGASDDAQVAMQEEIETLQLPDDFDLIGEDESHVEESDEDN